MAKNTGKSAEGEFEDFLKKLGKHAYFYRFKDASDLKGLTGKIGHIDKQPSDYIVVVRGLTAFSEVKSTGNDTSFPFSLLKAGQNAHALRILAAGGSYLVYVKRMTTGEWFRIPYEVIRQTRETGKASIPWRDLGGYTWSA
jgi:penicillin-binding protein-related factor A (putative recombinase)